MTAAQDQQWIALTNQRTTAAIKRLDEQMDQIARLELAVAALARAVEAADARLSLLEMRPTRNVRRGLGVQA